MAHPAAGCPRRGAGTEAADGTNDARSIGGMNSRKGLDQMRILLPTDGSRVALATARAISGWFAWPGGVVDVLAVTPGEAKSETRHFGRDTEAARDWRAEMRRWLSDTSAHLDASGLRVNELLRQGEPTTVTVDAAGEGYDLVALGLKGRGDTPFFDTDSVALALLERAPTSVLLVRDRAPRGPAHRLPTPQRPLRTILAIDGSDPGERAVRALSRLVAVDHVDLEVLTVADAAEGGPLGESEARRVAKHAVSLLQSHGISAEERVQAGEAASVILEAAREADLIVMGSRGGGAPDAPYIGSLGLTVARSSPCSVLIVREAEPAGARNLEPGGEVATPVEIAYENLKPEAAAERQVIRGLRRLERVAPELMAVRVTLANRNPRRHTGNLYDVRLELTLPGPDVAVSRTPPLHSESEDLLLAIGEAFDKARRELVESRAVRRGEVKTHEPVSRGRVTDLFPDHGFIRSSDGRIVYFHRNSIAGQEWDALQVGDEVRFRDEPGEQGPHATTVKATRLHSLA